MTTDNGELRRELKQRWTELQTLRDQIRVKLHLAGMDAKDAWNKLEPKLDKFGHQVEEVADDAIEELRHVADDLGTKLRDLQKDMKS